VTISPYGPGHTPTTTFVVPVPELLRVSSDAVLDPQAASPATTEDAAASVATILTIFFRAMPIILFSVLLQRTVLELQGIPSIELDDFDAIDGTRKQQLMCSRMFGQPITGLPDLSAAVSTYAQQASIRLRRQGSLAGMVTVFIATSPFNQDYQSRSGSIILTDPADDPLTIARAAVGTLPRMIDPHARYVRAGVMLGALTDAASYTTFDGMDAKRDHGLGTVLDQANRKFGLQSVGIGWAGMKGKGRARQETGAIWNMKRQHLSNRGTTRWDELAVAKAR
jgi:DNA polymerase V